MEFTNEELAMKSYKDLSNERLGEFTREIMEMLQEPTDSEDKGKLIVASSFHALINMAMHTNAKEINAELSGVTIKNSPVGNWRISVKEIK